MSEVDLEVLIVCEELKLGGRNGRTTELTEKVIPRKTDARNHAVQSIQADSAHEVNGRV